MPIEIGASPARCIGLDSAPAATPSFAPRHYASSRRAAAAAGCKQSQLRRALRTNRRSRCRGAKSKAHRVSTAAGVSIKSPASSMTHPIPYHHRSQAILPSAARRSGVAKLRSLAVRCQACERAPARTQAGRAKRHRRFWRGKSASRYHPRRRQAHAVR